MTLDDLIPRATVETVARVGLHKIAGAMRGTPELTLADAVTDIGARAFQRRKEARLITHGIAAYASVTNEKVANNPAMMALLQRALMPAVGGAAVAAVPHLMSNDPNKGSPLPSMGLGALLGGLGGAGSALHRATSGPLGSQVAHAVNTFDKVNLP